ncbi:MAG: HAD family hydrolase [Ignavibacteria bacterium]
MTNNYTVILFDFGGTLDTNGVHWSVKYYEAFKKVFPSLDFKIYSDLFVKADEKLRLYAGNISDYYELLTKQFSLQCDLLNQKLNLHISQKQYETMLKEIYWDVRDNINSSRRIISSLKQNYKIGVVSNFYGNLPIICNNLNLLNLLDIVVDSVKIGYSKPDPGIFLFALKSLNSSPEECIVVGDSYERDIKPSKQIGCKTIWLKGKSWKEESEPNCADFIITTLSEIKEILTLKTKIQK